MMLCSLVVDEQVLFHRASIGSRNSKSSQEEPFPERCICLNELKVAAQSYGSPEIPENSRLITSLRVIINRLRNPNLDGKIKHFEYRDDLALFDRRLKLGLDYYHKLTTDLLLDRPVPSSTGFMAVRDNIGSVSNRGVEVLMSAVPVKTSDLTGNQHLNFSYNKNQESSARSELMKIFFPGLNWVVPGSPDYFGRGGESLSSFLGYRRLGTWGVQREAGRKRPKWCYPGPRPNAVPSGHYFGYPTAFADLYDSWTGAESKYNDSQIRNGPYSGQNSEVDDHWVANGSFLRVNAISLGYTFHNDQLQKWGLKNWRVYASVQNAFLITSDSFKGYDPEATSWEINHGGQYLFFTQVSAPHILRMVKLFPVLDPTIYVNLNLTTPMKPTYNINNHHTRYVTSCKNFCKKTPKDTLPATQYFNPPEHATNAVNGLYRNGSSTAV
ncbi:hypothetical protein FQR65_LT20895 [Abscondita terminalis]|nr:hypothetical protein FQR65_LT20895 [Abscondita terminalis]